MEKLKVLVVDDSALFRVVLRNALHEIPGCEVVGTAADGPAAIEKIAELQPDLVTLDVEMPDMNGIAVLQELKRRRLRPKVVMVSRLTSAGAQVTTDALLQGAYDFILKPSSKDPTANKAQLTSELAGKIAALQDGALDASAAAPGKVSQTTLKRARTTPIEAVVIGCSTGGPDALGHVLPFLQPGFPVPIVIVQHMPEGFTSSLARRLNEASEIEVVEAEEGLRLRSGVAVIARGGRHLQLTRRGTGHVITRLTEDPHEHNCRPAVDYTLRSAIEAYEGRLLTVILTGMGKDGTEGCRLAREKGGEVIAQSADGCILFGMPKSVIKAGQADHIVSLPQIPAAIESLTVAST